METKTMVRMRSADRRRQLLQVAADLFARLGYRGTTTAELAKAAGITEPILYRHFDNKLHLFITLVDEVGRDVINDWQQQLEGVDEPAKRLEILLGGNPSTHEKGRGVYRVIFQAMTEVESDPEIVKALRKHLSKAHKFIRDELMSLQRAGFVRRDEPAGDLAWLFINVAVGYGMVSPLGVGGAGAGRKSEMERLLTDLVTLSK